MNEYMAVDDATAKRLATYPDVITTLDADGRPVSAGNIREGMAMLAPAHRQRPHPALVERLRPLGLSGRGENPWHRNRRLRARTQIRSALR